MSNETTLAAATENHQKSRHCNVYIGCSESNRSGIVAHSRNAQMSQFVFAASVNRRHSLTMKRNFTRNDKRLWVVCQLFIENIFSKDETLNWVNLIDASAHSRFEIYFHFACVGSLCGRNTSEMRWFSLFILLFRMSQRAPMHLRQTVRKCQLCKSPLEFRGAKVHCRRCATQPVFAFRISRCALTTCVCATARHTKAIEGKYKI